MEWMVIRPKYISPTDPVMPISSPHSVWLMDLYWESVTNSPRATMVDEQVEGCDRESNYSKEYIELCHDICMCTFLFWFMHYGIRGIAGFVNGGEYVDQSHLPWRCHNTATLSTSLAFCERNPLVTSRFSAQRLLLSWTSCSSSRITQDLRRHDAYVMSLKC